MRTHRAPVVRAAAVSVAVVAVGTFLATALVLGLTDAASRSEVEGRVHALVVAYVAIAFLAGYLAVPRRHRADELGLVVAAAAGPLCFALLNAATRATSVRWTWLLGETLLPLLAGLGGAVVGLRVSRMVRP